MINQTENMIYDIWDSQTEEMLTPRQREYFFPGSDGVLKNVKQKVGSAQAGRTILFSSSLDKDQVLITYLEDADPRYKLVRTYKDAMAYSDDEVIIINSVVESILSKFHLSCKAIDQITEYVVIELGGEDISTDAVAKTIAKYLEEERG